MQFSIGLPTDIKILCLEQLHFPENVLLEPKKIIALCTSNLSLGSPYSSIFHKTAFREQGSIHSFWKEETIPGIDLLTLSGGFRVLLFDTYLSLSGTLLTYLSASPSGLSCCLLTREGLASS